MSDKQLQNSFTTEYKQWINEIKQKFQSSQIKASVAVNSVLLEFYWNLGSEIVQKQKQHKWGSGFLEQLSHDLRGEFPDVQGFSLSNLQYIRRWVLFYLNSGTSCSTNEIAKVAQVVPELFLIPWGHNRVIISKCKTIEEALYYVQNTLKNGISRSVLIHQIETNLYARDGKAITNNVVVEYALKDINKPLGISEYELTEVLPKEYKSSLPSIEEIEAQFQSEDSKAVGDE